MKRISGYRAPLAPRLARPEPSIRAVPDRVEAAQRDPRGRWMSSATEAVTNAAFAGIASANGAPRRTSHPVRSASAHRMLIPAGTAAGSERGRIGIGSPSWEEPTGLDVGPSGLDLKREPDRLIEASKGDPEDRCSAPIEEAAAPAPSTGDRRR